MKASPNPGADGGRGIATPIDVGVVAAAVAAIALLVLTLHWRIPMMLWDHLVLAPMYRDWLGGSLPLAAILQAHNEHFYAVPYLFLLATTRLSGGGTWLDCLASWALFVGCAAIVTVCLRGARRSGTIASRIAVALVALLAWYPGHLPNLQWGWQIGVFLCLFGAALTIRCLAVGDLSAWRVAAALSATVLALASFATGAALIPTAIVLILLHRDVVLGRRCLAAAPWIALGLLLAAWQGSHAPAAVGAIDGALLARHVLNGLGGGIARFATDLAPWLALAALASGLAAVAFGRWSRDWLPWIGFCLFGLLSAVLIALGRAAPYGADQAFAARYVSFSSVFWIGWAGIVAAAIRHAPRRRAAGGTLLLAVAAVFAVGNAVHLLRKAAHVAAEARQLAAAVRDGYPDVDDDLLRRIYADQPAVARQCLDALAALRFPPFDRGVRGHGTDRR
jgi:hypothetical protein